MNAGQQPATPAPPPTAKPRSHQTGLSRPLSDRQHDHHSAPSAPLVVTFQRTGFTPTGERYMASLGDDVLCRSVREPIFAACRALVARGLTGRAEFRRPGDAAAAMIVPDIVAAAGRTVRETATAGPFLTRYRPFSKDDD